MTSGDDIVLPPNLVFSLLGDVSPTDFYRLVVADTGATNPMLPDRSTFISYKSVWHLCIRMGNNSYAPVLGRGTAIVSLNGQRLLIRNVLHVPALRVPLYSLWAHLRQSGCRFIKSFATGMHVYFLGVILNVDMSTNCHLSYEPLGKSTPLSSLHYVQPRCPPVLYPAESSAFHARAGAEPSPELCLSGNPVLIEDNSLIAQVACDVNDDSPPPIVDTELELPTFFSLVPKQLRWAKSTTFLVDNLALISKHLQVLLDRLSGLMVSPPPSLGSDPVAPKLLSSLSHEEVVQLVHRLGSALPPVCPCDWSNGSDTKTHWISEELHRALGSCRSRNYKHIIHTSLDGQWIDGGEFLVLLGMFTMILKAPWGGAIDCKQSFYLNIVHVDIAFGDCVLVGGFWYSLVFVD